ncbi:MAG: hypothetical protein MUE51_02680 [Thermoleophilia bacterium]|nr:hypothetical protein [Thermoleophilia bacterium]
MRTLLILAGVGVAWLWGRERDPRRWPDRVRREAGRLRLDLAEAIEAGRQADERREEEIAREMADARAGRTPRP